MQPDAIALFFTDPLDRVYPPMTWTSLWSTGTNMPLARTPLEKQLLDYLDGPEFYGEGLWLLSEERHAIQVPNGRPDEAGVSVCAWTRREALIRFEVR